MAQLIDGKAIAATVRAQVAQEARELRAGRGVVPGLAVVRVGEDPASRIYVNSKRKAAEEAGFNAWEHHFEATVSQAQILDQIRKLNENAAFWVRRRDMPSPNQGLAAVTGADGRIYILGGLPTFSGPTANVYAYDPDGDTWTQVASMSTPRVDFGAALGPDGRIYVFGGYSGGAYLNTGEVYDPSLDKWFPISPMQVSIRYAPAGATGPDGRIYAIGGYDGYGDLATVEAYDPNSDTWTLGSLHVRRPRRPRRRSRS